MTDVTAELLSKFQEFRRAGINARLNLECHGRHAWANLHVQLPHHPAPPAQYQRRPGPSRLRRRARRAEARKHAAEAAAQNDDCTEKVALRVADTLQLADAAVEAAAADILPLSLPEVHQQAEEAADHVKQQQHLDQTPEQGAADVRDVFCPDSEYNNSAVQAARDGDVLSNIQPEHYRRRQPQRKQERPHTGITLEDFQRLAAENSRKFNF